MPLLQSLSNRLSSLPLILCGPIVRRVEPEIVSVWVALKEERKIELELYTGYCTPTGPGFPGKTVAFKSSKIPTLFIGKHLHLALVTIETPGLFTHGDIFSYDLLFYKDSTNSESLISLGLLDEPELLGFKKGQLPSFIVPPAKLIDLRIAHGSCRKPHGRGKDGLATLAKIIAPDFTEPDRVLTPKARPHYFFHTGDQIYADDCSDYLIQHYTDAGNFLLQKVEELPFPKTPSTNYLKQGKNDSDYLWIQATSIAFPPNRRATNFYSGFTGAQSNHLFSFAEFAAAYLFQWSDVLWPKDLPDTKEIFFDKLNDGSDATHLFLFPLIKEGELNEKGEPEKHPDVPKDWDRLTVAQRRTIFNNLDLADGNKIIKASYERFIKGRQKEIATDAPHQKELVEDFRQGLKAVRRVLANVANIMSFDDHDITDDWYLSGRWAKQALGTRLGETIIRNGLLAFALFQAWGNDPKGWADKSVGKNDRNNLLNEIPELIKSFKDPGSNQTLISSSRPAKDKEFTDKFHKALGFDNFEKPPVKWHCFLKISEARVFVLDTRTRRDFSLGLDFPPNLLNNEALVEQIPGNTLPFGTELAIVVSGAPVLGLAAIESIGQPIIPRVLDVKRIFDTTEDEFKTKRRIGPKQGNYSLDVEHWSIHQQGFEALLKRCASLKKVLFLAGDVHYGITSEMDYWSKGEPDASRFVQMVSSSLKNIKPEGQLMGILPAGITQAALSGGLNREFVNLSSIGWEDPVDIPKVKLKTQTEPGQFRDARPSDYPLRIAKALEKKPLLVSLRDWPLIEFESADPAKEPRVLNRIVFNKECPLPTFRWQMNILADDRPDTTRFQSLSTKPASPEVDFTKGIFSGAAYETGLGHVLSRAAFYSRTHINRTVNWYSQVAIIDFFLKNGSLLTRQSMFFVPFLEAPDENKTGSYDNPLHQFEATLKQKTAAEQPEFPSEKNS